MTSLAQHADRLLSLHRQDHPVVLPTVWDPWSATAIVDAGFAAITVGSHPLADALGRSDGEDLDLAEALEVVKRITDAVDVPVSADLESGYDTPAEELVDRLLEAGAVGVNIEDTVHSEGRLRGAQEHADYIAAVRQRADETGVHVVVNGRTDVFKTTQPIEDRLGEAIHRLTLMEQAGADSLYPVALPDEATLVQILQAVNTPLNVTAHPVDGAVPAGLSLAELTGLGVRRVTFGPLLQAALTDHIATSLARWRA
ncbi:isocitrate lyase/PEP mutase family protein [Janibacter alittae]|uniref:Isocitrate lyase/phosphoenolpyruvate mutase family protein n=1 Tax=Janibacter alittae TaxID=3115209 RepID=A0ABZ2MD87_9MICO